MERRRAGYTPWAVVLLILAFSCMLAYGIAVLGTRVFDNETFGRYQVMNISGIQDLQVTSDGFVYYDGSAVSSISSQGDVEWSYLVGHNADFDASDYGVAAWSGETLTLIDAKSGMTTFNGAMEKSVMSARVGDKYTAILMGEETDSTMVLMENGGRQINKITLTGQTAVDYGFFSNGSLLWVMVCDTNGTVPVCNIQTYRPGKEIVGSIGDTQQLVYAVMFQSSQVCVAGDTYLKVYDYTGTEDVSKRELVYGWYLADSDEIAVDPLMAFVTDSQYSQSDIRDVRMIRSDLDKVVRLPFGCRDLVCVGDRIYGFASDGHLMILEAGSQKANAFRLNLAIDEVYGVTRDGVAILGSGASTYLVNMI